MLYEKYSVGFESNFFGFSASKDFLLGLKIQIFLQLVPFRRLIISSVSFSSRKLVKILNKMSKYAIKWSKVGFIPDLVKRSLGN